MIAVFIPINYPSTTLGPNGRTVRKIEAYTNTWINYEKDAPKTVVKIEGRRLNKSGVKVAVKLIRQLERGKEEGELVGIDELLKRHPMILNKETDNAETEVCMSNFFCVRYLTFSGPFR